MYRHLRARYRRLVLMLFSPGLVHVVELALFLTDHVQILGTVNVKFFAQYIFLRKALDARKFYVSENYYHK